MELQALLAKSNALPSIPKVVSEVLSELDADDPSPRKISQLVATDPALTARMLKLANSAFFNVTRQISSVDDAVGILGFSHVRTLVTAVALSSSFKAVPGVNLEQFWRYSLNTAKACRALAPGLRLNDGASFTAGLVHAVGDLVMHIGMPDVVAKIDFSVAPLDLSRADAERAHLGYTYADVGAGMAEKWQFPPEMVSALANQVEPFEGEAYDRLGGILHLASWRARAEEIHLDDQGLAATFPDMVGLTLGLDLDSVLGKDPSEWSFSQALGAFTD